MCRSVSSFCSKCLGRLQEVEVLEAAPVSDCPVGVDAPTLYQEHTLPDYSTLSSFTLTPAQTAALARSLDEMRKRPKPTYYAGQWFRSRLEARWAHFFTNTGLEWKYEPWVYETSHGNYLPDFILTLGNGDRILFEVKPDTHTEMDPRWDETADMSGFPIYLARGFPASTNPIGYTPAKVHAYGHINPIHPGFDLYYAFCLCPWCNAIGIEYEGRGERICGEGAHEAGWGTYTLPDGTERTFYRDKQRTCDDPRLVKAYLKAYRYRFPLPPFARLPKELQR